MQMEDHQPGSAAAGGGGLCSDDTTLIERVASSSFVAAFDRLLCPSQQLKNYCMA